MICNWCCSTPPRTGRSPRPKQKHVMYVRGNRAYTHIKELEDRGLITTEEKGQTKELDVTNDFLDYFELENLDEFKDYVDQRTDNEELPQ